MKEILRFLNDLKHNNNRDWFKENKNRYENAKSRFLGIVEVLISEISRFDKSIGIIKPGDTLFRIYRDTRFSKDKTPYKTNMGAFIAKGGRKSIYAGYYMHLEPGKSFAGGGIYMPDKEVLNKIRQHIYENPDAFKTILNDENFKSMFDLMDDDKLKRPPKGFEKDFQDIELLKYKSYVVGVNFTDDEITDKKAITAIMNVFSTMYPFNNFLTNAIEHHF